MEDTRLWAAHLPPSASLATMFFIAFSWEKCCDMSEEKSEMYQIHYRPVWRTISTMRDRNSL
jgi:hypothetical protein